MIDGSQSKQDELVQWMVLRRMPLRFNALVVESTARCNARCVMCYQSAGPEGSDAWGKAKLGVSDLVPVLREALTIETLAPRFHLAGGEAFIYPDECIRLYEIARDSGFIDITGTTNAYWARKRDRAMALAERLRQAGLSTLEISWDHWHKPWIEPACIDNVLDACHSMGITAHLRVLTSPAHSLGEALRQLDPRSVERATCIQSQPVFRVGRAAVEMEAEEFFPTSGSLDEKCHDFLNLAINALGNVYPCCAGFDQTDQYIFGNVRERAIADIAADMDRSLLLRMVVFGGISSLVPILSRAGIEMGSDYNNICHLCWSIFSRPDCVAALRAHFESPGMLRLASVLDTYSRPVPRGAAEPARTP